MGLFTTLPADFPEEVDVIIAGGGTAGCIVASRLAEADPSLSILVIEGGTDNTNLPTVAHPAFLALNLVPATGTALFYKGNKSEHLGGREPVVAAGGVLGGGSSVNFMMYTRPQRCDLDAWSMPGWSADELLPYFKKFETYHGQGEAAVHGHDGPVHVSDGGFRCNEFENAFKEGYKRLGYKEYKDLQDFDSNNGYAQWNRYVSPEGKRQDTASTYIHPKLASGKYPNLHVLLQSKIIRVLLDDSKVAYGVEWTRSPDHQLVAPNAQPPAEKRVARAKKLVVVSCGACGTPGVLERSGIGNPEILKRARVPLLVDLPGVGHDYQDHHLALYPFRTSLNEHQTVNRFISGRLSVEECVSEGSKALGWNGIDIAAKVRPTDAEVAALSPAFQKAWKEKFADTPNRPSIVLAPLSIQLIDVVPDPPAEVISSGSFTTHPFSRGHIHITGPEVTDPLDFETGFMSDVGGVDCEQHVWAYKKNRELLRRTSIYRGELAEGHPRFSSDSKARPVVVDSWDPENVADIEYSADDDRVIAEFVRETVSTTWHSLGTAKMAPRESMGVVDEKLNVYGTTRLKIVDLSVPPVNVAANTNSLALLVGEKAADVIIKELALAN